jgi:hypothetical protein
MWQEHVRLFAGVSFHLELASHIRNFPCRNATKFPMCEVSWPMKAGLTFTWTITISTLNESAYALLDNALVYETDKPFVLATLGA